MLRERLAGACLPKNNGLFGYVTVWRGVFCAQLAGDDATDILLRLQWTRILPFLYDGLGSETESEKFPCTSTEPNQPSVSEWKPELPVASNAAIARRPHRRQRPRS